MPEMNSTGVETLRRAKISPLNWGLFLMIVLIGFMGFYILYPLALILINSFNVATIADPPSYGLGAWKEAFTEYGVLKSHKDCVCEAVVKLGHINVLWGNPCHLKGLSRCFLAGNRGEVLRISCTSKTTGITHAQQVGRRVRMVSGSFCSSHDHSPLPYGNQRTVQQPEWVRNHSRVLMVFDGNGSAHLCVGIQRGVPPAGHRNGPELSGGRTIFIHMTTSRQSIVDGRPRHWTPEWGICRLH